MKFCFVGLGNPGASYQKTRHNLGFRWIDAVVDSHFKNLEWKERFESLWASASFEGQEIHFLKPQTYMNLSGQAVGAWFQKQGHQSQVIVVSDDLDLEVGVIRMKPSGGSGGQKGLQSIMDRLPGQTIPRLRIGIGRGSGVDASEHVLSKFTKDESVIIQKILDLAPEHFKLMVTTGIEKSMNTINRINFAGDQNGH